mgnify:CR=1 FL=1
MMTNDARVRGLFRGDKARTAMCIVLKMLTVATSIFTYSPTNNRPKAHIPASYPDMATKSVLSVAEATSGTC